MLLCWDRTNLDEIAPSINSFTEKEKSIIIAKVMVAKFNTKCQPLVTVMILPLSSSFPLLVLEVTRLCGIVETLGYHTAKYNNKKKVVFPLATRVKIANNTIYDLLCVQLMCGARVITTKNIYKSGSSYINLSKSMLCDGRSYGKIDEKHFDDVTSRIRKFSDSVIAPNWSRIDEGVRKFLLTHDDLDGWYNAFRLRTGIKI